MFIGTADDIRRKLTGDSYMGGRISDPSDPRVSGLQGAYPGLYDRAPWALPRMLYARVGLFRTIVDKPADDVWSQGWEIIGENEKLAKQVAAYDRRKRIKQAFKRATRLARRDGVAVVKLRLRDATGEPADEPVGVADVVRVEVHPCDVIQKIDFDENPDSDRYGLPEYYHLNEAPALNAYSITSSPFQVTRPQLKTGAVKTHWKRVILLIPHPKEGSDTEGDSVLSWVLADAHGLENVKWAAAEGYYQRNVPLLVAQVDKDYVLSEDAKKAVDDGLNKIVSGVIQRIRLQGVEIKPLVGSERINPPDPYATMFLDQLAGGSRIPKHELLGSAVGKISSADWDVKRYFNFISNDQEDFAEPTIREWYERLDEWGLFPGLINAVSEIHFFPHLEESRAELADRMWKLSLALRGFAAVSLPMPGEMAKQFTFPKGVDVTQPLELTFASGFGGGEGGEGASGDAAAAPSADEASFERARPRSRRRVAGRAHGDLRIEVSPQLRKLEARYERRVRAVLQGWKRDVLAVVPDGDSQRGRRRGLFRSRLDAPSPEAVRSTLMGVEFDSEVLRELIEDLLTDAADLGMLKTWAELGREGRVKDFVDTPGAPQIKQFAEEWSVGKARQATERLRELVARNMSEGGDLTSLKESLRGEFGVLENEAAITRTESMRGFNEGSRASMREADVRKWMHGTYEGACPVCIERDGQVYGISDPMPPDSTHPGCRCPVIPIVDEDG